MSSEAPGNCWLISSFNLWGTALISSFLLLYAYSLSGFAFYNSFKISIVKHFSNSKDHSISVCRLISFQYEYIISMHWNKINWNNFHQNKWWVCLCNSIKYTKFTIYYFLPLLVAAAAVYACECTHQSRRFNFAHFKWCLWCWVNNWRVIRRYIPEV